MPLVDFAREEGRPYDFPVAGGDFSSLEIHVTTMKTSYNYFIDMKSGRLVKDFLLEDGKQVATLCRVTLTKKDGRYSPGIRLWKRDKAKAKSAAVAIELFDWQEWGTAGVRASVDTSSCQANFWRLIEFLQSYDGIELPRGKFRLVDNQSAELVDILRGQDKEHVVAAVRDALGADLNENDIHLLSNRKKKLEEFRKLLEQPDYFDRQRVRFGKDGRKSKPEAVWQKFFESNHWIFGYGLNVISTQAVDDSKLERITTGANFFGGAGKRIDAILRSRGFISSLMFCEIKTHATRLLAHDAYRPPDVFRPSDEFSGGIAQLQKTVDKALREIKEAFHRFAEPDGTPSGIEVAAIKPKQALVIGQLQEFNTEHGINRERVTSFELFRRSVPEIEVITFDELFERVRFIVQDA